MEMRVDFHTHIIPEGHSEFCRKVWGWSLARIGENLFVRGQYYGFPAGISVRLLIRYGVHKSELKTWIKKASTFRYCLRSPVTFSYWADSAQAEDFFQDTNDFIAETVKRSSGSLHRSWKPFPCRMRIRLYVK